jgi:mannose/fructose/N-acetylgalactosamine-specific phosphotransferase system component IIC
MEILIHLASLTLALAAAAEAFSLIRLTGRSHAWLFFVLGFVLLAVERVLELFGGETMAMEYTFHESASDVLMLVMAVLYLYGIHQMRAVFLEHRATREAMQRELDELQRFQRLTVGRELRMKELVEENTALQQQALQPDHPQS